MFFATSIGSKLLRELHFSPEREETKRRITSEGRECVEVGEVLNKSVGSNEENIRTLFTRMRSVTACMIILVDEFEALVSPGEESIISSVHPAISRFSHM